MRWMFALILTACALIALGTPAHSQAPAPLSYRGKTVLVTGSTDGLGRELARALAADGAHVIVHGRNAERGQALVDEINEAVALANKLAWIGWAVLRGDKDFDVTKAWASKPNAASRLSQANTGP